MAIKDIESKLKELKGKQSDFFKKKKAERNVDEISAIRDEINELKEKAKAVYRKETPAEQEDA